MAKYQKRPVEVDAFQIPPIANADFHNIAAAMGGRVIEDAMGPAIELETRTGTNLARPGEWVIRSPLGEAYPCPADEFAQNYELAVTRAVLAEARGA